MNYIYRKNWSTTCRTWPSDILSTTKPQWKSLGSNPKLHSETLVTVLAIERSLSLSVPYCNYEALHMRW